MDQGVPRHRWRWQYGECLYQPKKCLDRLVKIRDNPKSSTDDVKAWLAILRSQTAGQDNLRCSPILVQLRS